MLPGDMKQDEESRRKIAQYYQPHVCVCKYSPGYEGDCKLDSLAAEVERLKGEIRGLRRELDSWVKAQAALEKR